jgi:exopolyphosphatase / guanosine-5'-triphosphate,3'-diphosphate pyrophosphatase
LKLAAIDIGSNAVRLLFINVYETEHGPRYVKDAMYRVPLRLGEEVFKKGKLSKKKIKDFVCTMQAFKKLIKVHDPVAYMACATSAMREASNADEVLAKIKKKAGLKITVISGQEEADFLFSNHVERFQPEPNKNYLYVDVGGGSTELILISNGDKIDRKSFNIGTLRLRDGMVEASEWEKMDKWMRRLREKYDPMIGVGTGGNINTMLKYFSKSKRQIMEVDVIRDTYQKLKDLTLEEKIIKYSLKPDRADVIVPAAQIFLRVMDTLEMSTMTIPKVGLADGMIHQMFEQIMNDIAED